MGKPGALESRRSPLGELRVVTSRAKKLWDTRSRERLDELEQIHAEIRGTGRGRRWYTRQFNLSLFVALTAQFQLFSRNLYDDAFDPRPEAR